MTFAKRLKQAMDERQMSQAELADQIGKGRSSVSQYISGKNIPKDDVIIKIAEVLDCTPTELKFGMATIKIGDDIRQNIGQNFDEDVNLSNSKNISVSEAAKILGKSEQFVRVALQTGVAPFGFAVKNKTVFSYHISPKKLAEYIEV